MRAGMLAGLALAVVVGGTAVHQMAVPSSAVPVMVQPAAPDAPAAGKASHKLPLSGLLRPLTAPLRALSGLGRGGGGGGGSDRGDGGDG